MAEKNKIVDLNTGLKIKGTLLHKKNLKLWLYNPDLLKKKKVSELPFYPYNEAGLIRAEFKKSEVPEAIQHIDSRNQEGVMYGTGKLKFKIHDKAYEIKTYSYESDWKDIESIFIFFTDRTSGTSTYGGGRVLDIYFPKGQPPNKILLNFNTAYNFLCAHSKYYNCPTGLTSFIDADIMFGEKSLKK